MVLGAIVMATNRASSRLPDTPLVAALQYLHAIPVSAVIALGYLVLSGLSFRFLALNHSWRTVTVALSLILSIRAIVDAALATAYVVPLYLNLGRKGDAPLLTITLGLYWGPSVALSFCSYLLWKLRASNNRMERAVNSSF
jgi:hypothetical protein